MDFVHLNVKTHYSLMNSLLNVDDLIKLSKKNEFNVVALCDINSTFGLNELYYKSNDLKPLLGVELEFLNDSYILYAKNYSGLQNIFYLTTLVNKGELTHDVLFDNLSNVICILNEKSALYVKYLKNQDVSSIINSIRVSCENLYFISTFEHADSIEFSKMYELKKLFGYEINYEKYSDKKYFQLLSAIKRNENYIRTN